MERYKYLLRECCPSCGSTNSDLFLDVKDFRVSKDFFSIHGCIDCGLYYTKQVPGLNDIGLFYKSDSYDSHRMDNRTLISRLYRIVREINLRKKISWLRKYQKSGLVVDYGCGLGHFVHALHLAGFESKGFEIDEDARSLSNELFNRGVAHLNEFFELDEASVDVITMWHVLEHIYDLNSDFSRICEKIKPGGFLFVAVPNFKSYDAQFYRGAWEAFDVPRHLYHFDKVSLVSFVERFGLMHSETIPMKFDGFYVSLRSEKNLSNGSFVRGLWNGLKSNMKGGKLGYSSHVFIFKKV